MDKLSKQGKMSGKAQNPVFKLGNILVKPTRRNLRIPKRFLYLPCALQIAFA